MNKCIVTWYVEGCRRRDKQRTTTLSDCHNGYAAVLALVEPWWIIHGGNAAMFDVVIVAPLAWAGRYPVEMKNTPTFIVGRKVE